MRPTGTHDSVADRSGHRQHSQTTQASVRGHHRRFTPTDRALLVEHRQRIGRGLLGRMARGEIEISHQTFNALPMDRTHNYVRDLSVAVDVLEPYEPSIEQMIPWLMTLSEPLSTLTTAAASKLPPSLISKSTWSPSPNRMPMNSASF